MRADVAEADRRFEVVRAADAWRAAGALDATAHAAIVARHADDRRRTRPAFRLLFFVFTLLGGQAVWGFLALTLGDGLEQVGHAVLAAIFATGAGLGAATAIEVQRLRRFGVEEALVALSLLASAVSVVLLAEASGLDWRLSMSAAGAGVAILAAAAAYRWGVPLCGGIALAGLLAAFYPLPGSRWLWLPSGAAAALGATRIGERPWTLPAHRRRLDEVAAVGWLAAYAAVHAEGVRMDLFGLGRESGLALRPGALPLAWTAMFLLPSALLAAGYRRRDRLQLALGAILLLVSGGGAADALDLGPLWLVLLASGLLLLVLALLARRAFAAAPGRVRAGFTDGPLYEGARHSLVEGVAAIAVFTPEPRRETEIEGFRGEGGEFGGGGASAKF